MKRSTVIKTVIIGIALVAVGLVVLDLSFRQTGTTTSEAIATINDVGGVEKINKDAEVLFNRFGTNGFKNFNPLYKSALTGFPSVASLVSKLGDYSDVVIIPDSDQCMTSPHK